MTRGGIIIKKNWGFSIRRRWKIIICCPCLFIRDRHKNKIDVIFHTQKMQSFFHMQSNLFPLIYTKKKMSTRKFNSYFYQIFQHLLLTILISLSNISPTPICILHFEVSILHPENIMQNSKQPFSVKNWRKKTKKKKNLI